MQSLGLPCILQEFHAFKRFNYIINSPGQRPEGVQDPQDGYVATVTCIQLLLHVYLCRWGDPPPDKF